MSAEQEVEQRSGITVGDIQADSKNCGGHNSNDWGDHQ